MDGWLAAAALLAFGVGLAGGFAIRHRRRDHELTIIYRSRRDDEDSARTQRRGRLRRDDDQGDRDHHER